MDSREIIERQFEVHCKEMEDILLEVNKRAEKHNADYLCEEISKLVLITSSTARNVIKDLRRPSHWARILYPWNVNSSRQTGENIVKMNCTRLYALLKVLQYTEKQIDETFQRMGEVSDYLKKPEKVQAYELPRVRAEL